MGAAGVYDGGGGGVRWGRRRCTMGVAVVYDGVTEVYDGVVVVYDGVAEVMMGVAEVYDGGGGGV